MPLVAGAILTLATSTTSQARPRNLTCVHVDEGPFPKFTRSGVWSSLGDELVLLDNYDRTLLRYTSNGKCRGCIQTSLALALKSSHPRMLTAFGGSGFLLQTEASLFLDVDSRFSYKSMPLPKSSSSDEVKKVYDFAAGTNDLVAFVDTQNSLTEQWTPGFLRTSAKGTRRFSWLARNVSDSEKLWYRLAMPYIAMDGDTAYVLRMNSPYALYRNDPSVEGDELVKVSALDPVASTGRNLLPYLPDLRGPQDLEPIANALRAADDLPVGLYSQAHRLFVLYRSAEPTRARWSLRVIDTRSINQPATRTISLNIDADFVSLVPGPRFWAVIAKSQPEGMREQRVTGIYIFRASSLLQADAQQLPDEICGS